MKEKCGLLSPSEWRVMEYLWADPKTPMELVRLLKNSTSWAKSTVTTMVRRMEEKGLIDYEMQGRTKVFRAVMIRKDAAVETELVSSLVDRSSLTCADIDELYAILDKAEEGSK